MPPPNSAGREKLIQILGRFVPVVARGLALGSAVLAVATLVFDTGEFANSADRYRLAAVYGLIAVASLAVSRAAKAILRRWSG